MLQVSGLHAGYGKVQVLHGIDLQVEEGKLVTLIGSNGAGKTTTLRALSGMIKPASGHIKLDGNEIAGLPSYMITRRGLAHSPENRRVFGTLSVADNLVMGAFPRLTGARAKGDVSADIERMYALFPRLKERREQYAGTLSGGEQQMLAMARALMLNPSVSAARRTQHGLGAAAGGGSIRDHRPPERGADHHAAGRAIRRRRARGGRCRLRARERAHGRLRSGRSASQRPGGEGGLPRRRALRRVS